ncbi:DMT family transporter [Acidimangrovimonas pyrenivorans]|uniref:DMT family transporter n=1 Tax=Acidimangrovimonas pyrenivorans TaxID=2030798 RepID=A0ABV7AER1_9RHOB
MNGRKQQAIIGAGLALSAVMLTATTDLLAKLLAMQYPVQQVNFLAALVGIGGAWLLSRRGYFGGGGLRTAFPWTMALRSVITVGAAVSYFLAYKHLQLTEVFVFSALLPVLTGLLSGPVLGEPVAPRYWVALAASVLGVVLVLPAPGGGQALYYGLAICGSLFGAVSLTLARKIGREEGNAAALVFYPQIALALMMGVTLPGHVAPMSPADIGLVVLFGLGFLGGKIALAAAFSRAPAMVVSPILNLQFFVLLAFGFLFFGDLPGQGIYLGAAIVIVAGLYVTFGNHAPAPAKTAPAPTMPDSSGRTAADAAASLRRPVQAPMPAARRRGALRPARQGLPDAAAEARAALSPSR